MKKVLPLSFLILVSVLAVIFVVKNPLADSPGLALYHKTGLPADKAGTYHVRLQATQKGKDQPEATIALISGKLTQIEVTPGTFVSRWTAIDELSLKGRAATVEEKAAVLGKPLASLQERGDGFQHYISKDFPKAWFRLQLNLLQRITAPARISESAIYQTREKEEMGQYLVEYTTLDRDDHYDVKKQFISYENPQIEMKRSQNTVHYQLTKSGRLISAEGVVGFHHDAAGGDEFQITLQADLVSVDPKPSDLSLNLAELDLADDNRVRLVATENRATDTIGFDEAMEILPRVTASTDGRDIALIFVALKEELRARPDRAIQVRDRILSITERDVASRRQLAAAFGALAQSDQPGVANLLANLIQECGDLFCKDQAIVALNDHTKPTPAAARKILDLVNFPPDADVASVAALAAGSIAYKIGSEIPEVSKTLIEAYKKPSNKGWKRSLVAGMGNHGDDAYLPVLTESLSSPEMAMRASSLYSLRHLQDKNVNEILTAAIEREKEPFVINEGLKAAAYRKMPAAAYERMAARVATIKNEEDAKEATRLFMKIYERNPGNVAPALAILRERSPVPNVKSVISRRLEESKKTF